MKKLFLIPLLLMNGTIFCALPSDKSISWTDKTGTFKFTLSGPDHTVSNREHEKEMLGIQHLRETEAREHCCEAIIISSAISAFFYAIAHEQDKKKAQQMFTYGSCLLVPLAIVACLRCEMSCRYAYCQKDTKQTLMKNHHSSSSMHRD